MLRPDRPLVSPVPEMGTHGLNGVPDFPCSSLGAKE
jgi:hypothetical protein